MLIEKKAVENLGHRGESYKEGMLLLIEHLTAKDWKTGTKFSVRLDLIKKSIEAIYTDYVKHLDKDASFNQNKKHFDSLLGKYNDILLQHTTLKDAFKSLLLAESCSVWKKGRENFETPVSHILWKEESGNFKTPVFHALVQSETPTVDEESSFQEYIKINNALLPPLWFERLALWQQNFIKANWKDLCAKSIPSSLRSVPGVANMSRHDFSINNQEALTYFRHATPFPIDLLKQAYAEQEGFRITCLNLAAQIRLSLDQQLNKSSGGEKIREVVILTQSLVSPGTAATLKSRHASDSSDNDTKIYEMKEKAVKRFQAALSDPTEPANKTFLVKWGLMVQRDGSLKYKEHSFSKITLLSTNHPLNIWRRFGVHPEQTKNNDRNTALLLGAVGRYLSARLSEKDDLLIKLNACAEEKSISSDKKQALIDTLGVLLSDEGSAKFDKNTLRLFDALQTLLSIPSGQGSLGILGFLRIGDKRHRQSLAAAMEAIISNCIGATFWVACKSGKDRTGGASAAYDAAAIFYELYGRFPRYDDTDSDRTDYLKIYKNLFESGHHQQVASQNAKGAEGLVRPKLYFPDDIKLDAQQVQMETELSRINKPKPKLKGLTEVFNHQSLEKELQDMKHKIEKKDKGDAHILIDWQRGLESESYFILGKSIKELRNGKQFEDEEDLMSFIEMELLNKIQDNNLKEYYLALLPFAFHQGGFSHVFSTLGFNFSNDVRLHSGTVFKKPDFKINFSPLGDGVQVEEITTCTEKFKRELDGDLEEVPLEEGGYHYQTHSCISVTLSPAKNKGHEVVTSVNHVVVDCKAKELKPYFFKKTGLLGVLVGFFERVKHFFKSLVAPKAAKEGFLDENWLNSLNKKAAKAESATEQASKPVQEQEALKDGLDTTTAPEADSRASKQSISPQQEVFTFVSMPRQSDLTRAASFSGFQAFFPSKVADGDCPSQHGSSSPCLTSSEGS
ncbi:hypothetical protein [Rickettsiella endosymbiont of Dermanyssus gallinae]|uniref:hypothetical protein n=1 Tax=Rickettsiella endosymbiont of Dermanyssus gallinae TaxID=2856608 RepID=UPI001C52AA10|nr:hypothetical protein [Rickettsiella endosymbiont of Dermanyssus gallinae]